jgi:hypothetical protein
MSRPGEARPRILFSCLSESDPEWLRGVTGLVSSLRRFGGSSSSDRFVVNYVDRVPAEAEEALSGLGAETRRVEGLRDRGPQNKLRMLDLHQDYDFDVLVALDCDTAVVEDPAPHIPGGAIGAKPVDRDPISRRDWRRLYGALPSAGWDAGEGIPPCFNSGVLTVPRSLCEPLRREWLSAHDEVAAALGSDSRLIPRHLHFFSDQFSLALCLARSGLDVDPLPPTMNFPTHVSVPDPAAGAGGEPIILHYHRAIDRRGFLYRPRSPLAAEAAERFNRARASDLGLDYPGLRSRSRAARWGGAAAERFFLLLALRQRLRSLIGAGATPASRRSGRCGRSGA